LYKLPCTIRIVTWRWIRWPRHTTRMIMEKISYRAFVEQTEEKRPTSSWTVGLHYYGSYIYSKENCGNESSGSTWGASDEGLWTWWCIVIAIICGKYSTSSAPISFLKLNIVVEARSILRRIFFASFNIITKDSSHMLLWMLLYITDFLFQQNVFLLQRILYI
jgi:hypothetical protein